ncbi:Kef-type K+ transport system membrane component KefB [Bradyrhizobium japonicum]|jgi:Kef-type K+ transport system membrane component KefB|uniref:hypothetical protein n=1 Tax=Bradyrhizobium elkanii TaxID=29448 RepID=UPI001143B926|nr:hypothetical protein [Bradyrhizobium elkanii]MCP1969792.1 Kef-type K+ transport system membrane component KefB [Bradyrhizobium elkanii]MCS3592037.1 Kef-type K+ transport system membrane component KefB [Bradyrhizobium elkanii]MCS3621482.1 Kef-type K+ transport system membrane component KefB [Bradyrhizobium elkanii]MCS4108700.1 Kef-type K+ transport system membrane component KefB [Bradyrhizobium elkanii]MCW2110385.1 Kef-type K+ transport system membrane component KefB [Bradyrhizobium elkanii]
MSGSAAKRPPGSRIDLKSDRQPAAYRAAWLCLPVMLALSGVVPLVFGFSWQTALIIVLLLACPAAMATAVYFGMFAKNAH